METTILGKRAESTPLPGHSSPPLRPTNPRNFEEYPASGDTEYMSALPNGDVDGISWLNGNHTIGERLQDAPGDRFTLAGCDGIELSSVWLRDIISSAPRQLQQSTTLIPYPPASSLSQQLVPSTSAWEEWE